MPIEPLDQRQNPEPRFFWGRTLMWVGLLMLVNLFLFRDPAYPRKPYSEFLAQVEAEQVVRADISSDRIIYELKTPTANQAKLSTTPLPNDPELTKLLRSHHVEFAATPVSGGGGLWFLLIPLLIFGLVSWIGSQAQMGGPAALTIGKSKARIYSEGTTGVKFADVAGVDEAKIELQEIVDFLQHAEKYTRLGAKIPKGVLLVGPPGTGKTLLAKAIAGEAGVPFFSISGSEFIELFVGIGAARVRDLFEQAKRQAPCIVFIDELDALGKSRANAGPMMGSNDERDQTLNQLLAEMDGFDPNTGVILLSATNRPEVLDPALLRPGRFDRQILVDRPDKSGRQAILEIHSRLVRLGKDVDLTKLAARTPGFAGADLANLVNEAALLAARENHEVVAMADFNEAIERVVAGLQKKSRVLNELEKQIVAHHEIGHALIASTLPGMDKVEKVSIVPRGFGALGYTLQLPEEDRFLMTEAEIRGRIVTLLGGRAAEELIFGGVSTGASDDIQKATDLAERFVTLYGMSHKLGPVAYEKAPLTFLEGMTNPRRAVSPLVAEAIDHEVQTLIEQAHQIAREILQQNQTLLKDAAQILLAQEILEGEPLRSLLSQVELPSEIQPWLRSGFLEITKRL